MTFYAVPDALQPSYGRPISFHIFLRIRPVSAHGPHVEHADGSCRSAGSRPRQSPPSPDDEEPRATLAGGTRGGRCGSLRPSASRAITRHRWSSARQGAGERRQQQQPAGAERDAGRRGAAGEVVEQTQRAEPRDHRDAGEQAQPPDLAIPGLARQLEPQRAARRAAFCSRICSRSSSRR